MFSDPVTLPKKPEPATPDAEGGDGADAEDVQRFVFFLVTVFKSVYLFLKENFPGRCDFKQGFVWFASSSSQSSQ